MTNGIVIGVYIAKTLNFDYWLDKKCTSGYAHGSDSLKLVFNIVLNDPNFHSGRGAEMYSRYAKDQRLAVPEQLVWWGLADWSCNG